MEALNFVGSWIGVRQLLGLEAWRATYRPDLPTIDRAPNPSRSPLRRSFFSILPP
jgi:hypothetical protein